MFRKALVVVFVVSLVTASAAGARTERSGPAFKQAGTVIPATTFPGFAFCLAPRSTVWPAYDSHHQYTITRTYFVYATNPSYTGAHTTASPFYFVGADLNHFYKYRASDNVLVAGPISYAKASSAWIPNTHPEYNRAYNLIKFRDGTTTTTAGTVQVESVGPQSSTSPVGCYFP
ncbi:MAG: hypothetical protein QOE36_3348 [Gaiellaceae bacterium]|nr:hypothetical protein [Gaiellaceae bacterium]